MEFSESAKANAVKFLKEFTASGAVPGSGNDSEVDLPVRMNWPSVSDEEVEGECLDMAKGYLARRGCPGILSYHISAEACHQLLQSGRLESCRAKEEDVEGEGKKKPRLNTSLVARELLAAVHTVCGLWADSLPPLTCPPERIELSFCAIKNTRRKMEDRHIVCVDVNSLFGLKGYPHQAFFGVLDGHIGVEAAVYSSVHILPNIVRHPAFLADPEKAMKEGILSTDQRYCEKGIRSGSTAVVTLTRGKQLYVGWVGDSQAWLVRRGKPVQLMEPHKPDREDEQQRIEAAGGMVLWMGAWRVNGNLSVSRAIGDPSDKKYILGEADVRSFELDGTEDYLVVACDGIWDVVNGEELTECVHAHFSKGGTKNTVAKAIIEFARSEGSGDNMTAIVVFFSSFQLVPSAGPGSQGSQPEDPSAGPGSRGSQPEDPSAGPGSQGSQPEDPSAGPGSQGSQPEDPSAGPGSQGSQPQDPSAGPGSRGSQLEDPSAGPGSQGSQPEDPSGSNSKGGKVDGEESTKPEEDRPSKDGTPTGT